MRVTSHPSSFPEKATSLIFDGNLWPPAGTGGCLLLSETAWKKTKFNLWLLFVVQNSVGYFLMFRFWSTFQGGEHHKNSSVCSVYIFTHFGWTNGQFDLWESFVFWTFNVKKEVRMLISLCLLENDLNLSGGKVIFSRNCCPLPHHSYSLNNK